MKLSAKLLLIASFVGWSKLAYSTSARSNGGQKQHDLAVLLHNRIVGVPAQGETLQKMVALLQKGKIEEAALLATEHPFFYDLKLRALFTPWSNREGSVSGDLNDMVMTMIGIVRDDLPFDKVLSADLHYAIREDAPTDTAQPDPDPIMAPRSSMKVSLQQHKQSEKLHKDRDPALISGVLSTNAFASAFYSAGTNRRATAFVLKNFLCHEMEQLHDTETPKHWVRQDVSRSPGGDPELFNQRCVGCHAGMDALSGWSVFYDWPGPTLTWDNSAVRGKVTKNVLYRGTQGRNYNIPANANDSFTNLWVEGKNAKLGWRGKTSGNGAKEFGEMMTRSKAFASCMARQVYESVCYLKPDAGMARTKSEQLAERFEKDNYNMRKLFAATAVSCLTQKKEENTQAGGEETRDEN